MDSAEMTCTRCGGHQFIAYCKHCDPSMEEIIATAKAEALKEVADCEGCWLDDDTAHIACINCRRAKPDLHKTIQDINIADTPAELDSTELEQVKAERDRLLDLINGAIIIQKNYYGNATDRHIELSNWSLVAQKVLASLPKSAKSQIDIAGEVRDMLCDSLLPTKGRAKLYDEIRARFPAPKNAKSPEAEPERGTEENPFTSTFNSKCFKRHDSDLFIGICERDNGFEISVIPVRTGPTRHYRIDPSGLMCDLVETGPEVGDVVGWQYKGRFWAETYDPVENGYDYPSHPIVLMRAAEVQRRIEAAHDPL